MRFPRLTSHGHSRARTITLLTVTGLLAIPAIAAGVGENTPVDGGTRNPTVNPADAYTAETEIISDTSTYGTRQSNKKVGDGGGAIYGCRSNPGNEPCIRANNLQGGRAFEFNTAGNEAGRIEVGNVSGAPFTTNAQGVATGLNADKVDGKDAADLDDAVTLAGRTPADYDDAKTLEGKGSADFAAAGDLKFAVVNAAGNIVRERGGATGADIAVPADFTYRVTFSTDVSKCSYTATPTGDASDETLAVEAGTDGRNVRVDADGATGFQLQVIC